MALRDGGLVRVVTKHVRCIDTAFLVRILQIIFFPENII